VSGLVHVEMYDSGSFCGIDVPDGKTAVVLQHEWHNEPESLQSSTCPECLARVYMLGDSAAIALARLGLKIEVRDATEAEANPS